MSHRIQALITRHEQGERLKYIFFWGIGLAADAPQIEDPATWQGQNLLGFALMDVRRQLVEQME